MKGARALAPGELRAVIRELRDRRDRALFLLMLYTGARISEALALEVSDVTKAGAELGIRRQIVFPKRKTKGERVSRAVDVHPELAGALVAYLATGAALLPWRSTGPLFLARGRRRLSRVQAWRAIHAAFLAAGLEERVSPHSLRKTFAQRLHESGSPMPVIQELLGHADIRDTREYLEVPEDECSRAIRRLPPLEDDPGLEPSPG